MVKVRALGEKIGVEVSDVDVSAVDEAEFATIYQAWLGHNVMVIPGQALDIGAFLEYSRRFGILEPHPSKSTRHPDYPEITMLGANKWDADGKLNMAIYRRGAEGWHTDGAYDAVPFKATQLYAVAIPSEGGDTLFASMYAAYDALPPELKERLEGRFGAFTYGGRRNPSLLLDGGRPRLEAGPAPIVRTHPETGRKALYFDPGQDRTHRGSRASRKQRAHRRDQRAHDPAERASIAISGASATS